MNKLDLKNVIHGKVWIEMEETLPGGFVTEKVSFYNFVMQSIFSGLILEKK